MKILVFMEAYLPGYKAGGPVRSIANLVERMPSGFDFWIYTKDRDLGDVEPYPGVELDTWLELGRAHVFYASGSKIGMDAIVRAVREVRPEIVYSNSFFSRLNLRYLLARAIRWVPATPFVIAPRGEFSRGALSLKSYKKAPFLALTRRSCLLRNITWQASTEREGSDISDAIGARRMLRHGSRIIISPNMIAADDVPPTAASEVPRVKEPGFVRFGFVSRVSRMKNVEFAVRCLARLQGNVTFDIIGPIEDARYWESVQRLLSALPEAVKVRVLGQVPHAEVGKAFERFDFFLFPTLGENFGHVIYEALSHGCPAVLSDRTPWRGLAEAHAGFDLSLDDEDKWIKVMQHCVDMKREEHQAYIEGARRFARNAYPMEKLIRENTRLFELALLGS